MADFTLTSDSVIVEEVSILENVPGGDDAVTVDVTCILEVCFDDEILSIAVDL